MPGQQFGDLPCRVIGNGSEHVGQIVLRVEAIELGGLVSAQAASASEIGFDHLAEMLIEKRRRGSRNPIPAPNGR